MVGNGNLNPSEGQIVETKDQQGEFSVNPAQQTPKDLDKEDAFNDGTVGAEGESSSSGTQGEATPDSEKPEEKPKSSKLKTLWSKLGLDPLTLILMLK
jgi:hypothetical protein